MTSFPASAPSASLAAAPLESPTYTESPIESYLSGWMVGEEGAGWPIDTHRATWQAGFADAGWWAGPPTEEAVAARLVELGLDPV